MLPEGAVDKLKERIDEIMLGTAKLDYSKLMMQLDSDTGRYEDIGEQSLGHKGSTLNYRKVLSLSQLCIAPYALCSVVLQPLTALAR